MADARLQVIIEAVDRTASAFRSASQHLDKLGSDMSRIGRTLSIGVSLPLAAVGAGIIKTSIDFENGMSRVRAATSLTSDEILTLETQLRALALRVPIPVDQLAKLAATASQLGIGKDQVLGFTETIAQFSAITDTSAEDVSKTFIRLANIMGTPKSSIDRMASSVIELSNNLSTSEQDILDMVLSLGSAGKQVSLSESQIFAMAGALTSLGVESTLGGNAFSRIMIAMADATQSGGHALRMFSDVSGITMEQFQKSFSKDAAGAIITFLGGMDRMGQSGENVFAILDDLALGDVRVRDSILRAAGATDIFRESIDLSNRGWRDNSALTKEAAIRFSTTGNQMTMLLAQVRDISIEMGKTLIPALRSVLDALKPLFTFVGDLAAAFGKFPAPVQATVVVLAGFLIALGPVLVMIGNLVNVFNVLWPVIQTVGKVLAALAAGPVGVIILALGGLGLLVLAVIRNFENLKAIWEDLQQFKDWMISMRLSGFDAVREAFVWLGEQIAKDFMVDLRWVMKNFEVVKEAFVWLGEQIAKITSITLALLLTGYEFVKERLEIIGGWVSKGWDITVRFFQEGFQTFINGLEVIKKVGESIARSITNFFINAFNEGIIDSMNAIIRAFNDIPLIPDIPEIPRIPTLAHGGIVSKPTLALLGEQGPEMVMPLAGRRGSPGGIAPMFNVTLVLDGRVIAEAHGVLAENTEQVRSS